MMDQYFDDNQHPATAHLSLGKLSFTQFCGLIAGYLLVTTKIIPYFMRKRKAFNLQRLLFVFNVMMVGFNIYFFVMTIIRSEGGRIFFDFEYRDPKKPLRKKDLEDMVIVYFVYKVKFLDWMDTMFMALRKKNDHMTFLHLYHHSVVPLFGYMMLRINPFVGVFGVFAICNSFVHVVMHSYYALSTFPQLRKYLWWKKYVTALQLGQFAVYIAFGIAGYIFVSGPYPKFWLYFAETQGILFFWPFYNFYRQAYKTIRLIQSIINY